MVQAHARVVSVCSALWKIAVLFAVGSHTCKSAVTKLPAASKGLVTFFEG